MIKKEDHYYVPKNFKSLTQKNAKGILYPNSIATYFENSPRKEKMCCFSAVNSLKINKRPYFFKSLSF